MQSAETHPAGGATRDAWDAVPDTVLGSREGGTGSRGPRNPGGGPGGWDRDRGGLVTGLGIREMEGLGEEVEAEVEDVEGVEELGWTMGSPVSRSTSMV